MADWAIYGATGYSGELAARRAVEIGHRPLLMGRSEVKLAAIAEELGLRHRTVALDDRKKLAEALDGLSAVLNCAGPFVDTWMPIVDACLATGTHYLDITGELDVIEAIADRAAEARSRGLSLIPAVGFDVVPSDCLALHVANRLPSATRMTIAMDLNSPASHGTANTILRVGMAASIRKDGRLEPAPLGAKQRKVDFGFDRGEAVVSLIRWGDLSTAYRSTGIANIETYGALLPDVLKRAKRANFLAPLLRLPALRRSAIRSLTGGVAGPSEQQRQGRSSWLFAEAADDTGGLAASRLRVPHPYTLTALTSVEATVRAAVPGHIAPGFQTAAMAFGPDFILEFDGVERQDT
jgi:short subunit dehydrogenase-like uncharacterized protein